LNGLESPFSVVSPSDDPASNIGLPDGRLRSRRQGAAKGVNAERLDQVVIEPRLGAFANVLLCSVRILSWN
jgi:hypothetical protein